MIPIVVAAMPPTRGSVVSAAHPRRGRSAIPAPAAVIEECNRLRMLVDLAHADLRTTEAALKAATLPVRRFLRASIERVPR
jgi:hypothetical protein